MSSTLKKAILVVSFGTSFEETRKRTIDVIEDEIRTAYPDYAIYTAWTSKMIIKKLATEFNIKRNTVSEAMQQMYEDGIQSVVIQPTHIIPGVENDIMTADALEFKDKFAKISFSTPLLATTEDNVSTIKAIMTEHSDLDDDTALVLMGHGTSHNANNVYAAMDYMFKDLGYKNVFVGTVEGYPSLENVLKFVKEGSFHKIRLAPLMLVAGDHALNDLCGDEDDAWKVIFTNKGFSVDCFLKGLGEYSAIRQIYMDHLKVTIEAK